MFGVFCSNELTLGGLLGENWLKPWLETWNFQPHPPFSWDERRTGNGVNNWSCLHDKASTKIPIVWSSENFQFGDIPQLHGARSSVPVHGTLSDVSIGISSSGCSSVPFVTSFFFFFLVYFLFFVFVCLFVWPSLWDVEVPGPGTEPAPQQQPKLLQQQHQILNLLCQKGIPVTFFNKLVIVSKWFPAFYEKL